MYNFYVNDIMYADWIFVNIIRQGQVLKQLPVNLMKGVLISICACEHYVFLNY